MSSSKGTVLRAKKLGKRANQTLEAGGIPKLAISIWASVNSFVTSLEGSDCSSYSSSCRRAASDSERLGPSSSRSFLPAGARSLEIRKGIV